MSEIKNQYLNFEVTGQSDSVEKLFCEKFSQLKSNPLTPKDSNFLISLLFVQENDSHVIELANSMLNQDHKYGSIVAIIIQRRFCDQYNFFLEKRLLILLSGLIDSPGHAVMFGTYLAYWSKQNNKKTITLDDFCSKMFPFGLPTEDELSNLWSKQRLNFQLINLVLITYWIIIMQQLH